MKQTEVEAIYSRKNIRTRIKGETDRSHHIYKGIVKAITIYRSGSYYLSKQKRIDNLQVTSNEIADELIVSTVCVLAVSPIQAIVAQLGNRLGYSNLLDGIKTAAEIVAVCESIGLYTLYHSDTNEIGTLGIMSNYELDNETQKFIDNTKYLPPMIERPKEWTTNNNGGYLAGSGSVILGNINYHNNPQSLDVINILQNIEWSICEMVDFVEKSKKPLDTAEKTANFNAMTKQSLEVYEWLLEEGNKFYFTWKFDSRGRMYSQGYHCNLQATEYKKAILNFNHEELIK